MSPQKADRRECQTAVMPESLFLRFLDHQMSRVFRGLAFGYGKPQRLKVQTIEQGLSLTKKNGCSLFRPDR